MNIAVEWTAGLLGSAVIAGAAYWKRSLSFSGMLAAIVIGTVMYVAGGAEWFVPLIVFFVTSSLLSKWRSSSKARMEAGYEKTGRRDAGQVLANGGIGMLLCLADAAAPHPLWWFAYIGVTATVTADTWATEAGSLSRKPPRSVLTGRQVPAGTSGGVSPLGLLAAAAGALLIGAAALLTGPAAPVTALAAALLAGFAGALFDSLLGASVQQSFRCPVCGSMLEAPAHCGGRTTLIRGIRGFNNDAVNAVSSAFGGVVCAVVMLWV